MATNGYGPKHGEKQTDPGLFEVGISYVGNGATDSENYAVRPVPTFHVPEDRASAEDVAPDNAATEEKPPIFAEIKQGEPLVLRALNHFAERNRKLGLLEAAETKAHGKRISQELGADKAGLIEDADFYTVRLLGKARTEFARAFNIGLVEKIGEDSAEVSTAFTYFYRMYGLREGSAIKRRDALRRGIEKRIAGRPLRTSRVIKNLANTVFDPRYLDITMPILVAGRQDEAEELPQLRTIAERFGAVMEATDAGYRPGSKMEATRSLALLAEWGAHGKKTFGHRNLSQALVHNKNNLHKAGYGNKTQEWGRNRVFISLIYEVGDYLMDARKSQHALAWLKETLGEDINPNVRLADVLNPNDVKQNWAVATLTRHLTLQWLEQGIVSEGWFINKYGFRPLTHVEDRKHEVPKLPVNDDEFSKATQKGGPYGYYKGSFARFKTYIERRIGSHPDFTQAAMVRKNKTIHDPFTNPNRPPEVTAYIKRMAEILTVADIRTGVADEAMAREKNREIFYADTIKSVHAGEGTLVAAIKRNILEGRAA